MTELPKGFGGQLYDRMQGRGLSKSQVYKALTLQKLDEEVAELGSKGLLGEGQLLEIAKITSPARQKQLAEVAVERSLPAIWVKELSRVIRLGEKATTEPEAGEAWDFFFVIKEALGTEGLTKLLLDKVRSFKRGRSPSVVRPPEPPPEKAAVVNYPPVTVPAEPSVHEVVAQRAGESAWNRKLTDYRKLDLQLGRGLDVGTTNICSAVETMEGEVVYNIQRNAFLDVRSDAFTQKMLMQLGIDHIVRGGKGYVLGDPAFELANIFEKNTRRPMKDGLISPLETEALMIVEMVAKQLLGPPKQPGEICAFSVPAEPIDADRNVIYHRGALETILRRLGYQPKPMMEGHSVVFAELEQEQFTGIGVSCGGGMFNISIAYRAMPAMTFSTSRGGDWIDNNVAAALGMPSSQVCALKESGVNLMNPRNRVEEAIVIYYRNLIQYSLQQIRQQFERSQNMPVFSKPIDLVCAGGTSMIEGFIDAFRDEFKHIDFPIEIRNIRLAADPLRAVSLGCMRAAREETKATDGTAHPSGDMVSVSRADVTSTTQIDQQKRRMAQNRESGGGTVGLPSPMVRPSTPTPAPEPEPEEELEPIVPIEPEPAPSQDDDDGNRPDLPLIS